MTIGDKLRRLKLQSGFTLRHIADTLDVSTSEVAGFMSGRRRPGLWKVVDLARCFNVTVEEILGGVDRWHMDGRGYMADYRPRWKLSDS